MKAALWLGSVFLFALLANAEEEETPSIADKTAGMERLDGFFNVYWDENTGKLYWEIDKFDEEFL